MKIVRKITGNILYESTETTTKRALEDGARGDADLCSADLRGADLHGAYLRGADLCDADFRGTDLCSADLRGADLCSADLRGAYLRGADLCDAYLRGAYLCSADLCNTDLRGADLRSADLRSADLHGAYLRGADLCSADLRGADLRNAKGYSESLDIFIELVRRERTETITKEEWEIIGLLAIHRLCWDAIKKRFGKNIVPLFKKIAEAGFGEYRERYEEILKVD